MRFGLPLVLAALVVSAPAAQRQRFTLAIVRHDGAIVPFAAYDAGRWERAWPEADEATEPAPTIDTMQSIWRKRGERIPRDWTVWPATGATPVQAQMSGIDVVDAHCGSQVALKTNLRAMKDERSAKFGVAVDSKLPVATVEEIHKSSPAWRSAAQMIVPNFEKSEAAYAQAVHDRLPRETPKPAVRIAALYREAKSPRSPIYFVAEKKYRTPSTPQDPSCERITVMTGWLVPVAGGGLRVVNAKVFLSDCDEKDLRTAVPLAAVHLSDHAFWVLREFGYEDESYLIADIGTSNVVYPIEVSGGGC